MIRKIDPALVKRAEFLRAALLAPFGFLLAGTTGLATADTPDDAPPPLRISISDRVIYGVNPSDAGAAMAIWAAEVFKSTSFRLALPQNWVLPSDRLLATIRSGDVDLFCVTVQEFRQVAQFIDTSRVITDNNGGDELLLIVREGSGITKLADLRGKKVILHDSPATKMAEAWFIGTLLKEGLGQPRQCLESLTKNPKLSQVVLPLYFGQADVCVVTRLGLSTMFEMNPQLSRKLKILLTSPQTVSAFFACRKNFPERYKQPLFDRLANLRSHPVTAQVLMLFHSSGFAVRGSECLRTSLSILDFYETHREVSVGRIR